MTKKSKFTEEQIAFALRQAECGVATAEACRTLSISEQTYYRWKKKYAGMDVAEVRRLDHFKDQVINIDRCALATDPEGQTQTRGIIVPLKLCLTTDGPNCS